MKREVFMIQAQRYETKERASVEIYGKKGQMIVNVRNLSATGACLECDLAEFEIRQGDLIRMTVMLKTLGRKHYVNAEVVWRHGHRTGVSFVPSHQVLDRLLEKNS